MKTFKIGTEKTSPKMGVTEWNKFLKSLRYLQLRIHLKKKIWHITWMFIVLLFPRRKYHIAVLFFAGICSLTTWQCSLNPLLCKPVTIFYVLPGWLQIANVCSSTVKKPSLFCILPFLPLFHNDSNIGFKEREREAGADFGDWWAHPVIQVFPAYTPVYTDVFPCSYWLSVPLPMLLQLFPIKTLPTLILIGRNQVQSVTHTKMQSATPLKADDGSEAPFLDWTIHLQSIWMGKGKVKAM